MPFGTIKLTQHFRDHLTPEHEKVFQAFLDRGTDLTVIQDEANQCISYVLDHPDFTAGENEVYQLNYVRNRRTQNIYISSLAVGRIHGRKQIVKVYEYE